MFTGFQRLLRARFFVRGGVNAGESRTIGFRPHFRVLPSFVFGKGHFPESSLTRRRL